MESKGKFKVATISEYDIPLVYNYEVEDQQVKVWYEGDEKEYGSAHSLITFEAYVKEGAWVILEEPSPTRPFQIGDTVVCNLENESIIKDKDRQFAYPGWSANYKDFLSGKPATITDIQYGNRDWNKISYELTVVGHSVGFLSQDSNEFILKPVEEPIQVNHSEFSETLKQEFLKQMEEDDKLAEEFNKPKSDAVNAPKHYAVFEQLEAIEVIASSMTQDQFYGYCLGNCLKYRLRAGGKDDVMQELAKANKYQELYTQHKSLCKKGEQV